jgi:hypothetical protein
VERGTDFRNFEGKLEGQVEQVAQDFLKGYWRLLTLFEAARGSGGLSKFFAAIVKDGASASCVAAII